MKGTIIKLAIGAAVIALVAGLVSCGGNNNTSGAGNTSHNNNAAKNAALQPSINATVPTSNLSTSTPGPLGSAAVSPSALAAAGAQTISLTATDTNGAAPEKFSETKLTAQAGKPISLTLKNDGQAIHNWDLIGQKDADGKDIKTALLNPGQSATIVFTISKPGTYNFQCDVHPADMKGTLTVK